MLTVHRKIKDLEKPEGIFLNDAGEYKSSFLVQEMQDTSLEPDY